MRLVLGIFFSIAFLSLKAQTPYSPGTNPFMQGAMVNQYYYPDAGSWGHEPGRLVNQYRILPDSNSWNQKWSLNKYAGLSTGFQFYGPRATLLSAPAGIQLTRRLTNNVYAFAGVSIAPTYLHFNPSFDPSFNKSYPGAYAPAVNQFGLSSRAEMGLLYVNDQRTFSISGSIGVGRNSYPAYRYNSLPLPQPVAPFGH